MIYVVFAFGDAAVGAPTRREDYEAAEGFMKMVAPFSGDLVVDPIVNEQIMNAVIAKRLGNVPLL